MRDKLIQFIDNLNGEFVEVSYKEAPYQCLDLAYCFVFCLGFPKSTIQHLYAYQVYTEANDFTREYFEVIKNEIETIPQAGDLAVFKGGEAGHIAIVIEATKTRMKVFEQNNPLGTNAHIQDRTYTNVLGFLRPKFAEVDGVPQWLITLLQEIKLTIKNEAEIRAIFDKAKRYDDEVNDLREQVKSANDKLSETSAQVSMYVEKVQSLDKKKQELEESLNTARAERDKAVGDAKVFEIQNEKLQEENEGLLEEVTNLDLKVKNLQNATLEKLDWWTRFFSLFGKYGKS